ncbi:MAG: lytic transglycosylase domain-containing protein [Clostridiales bacterium]|nr:lytic transglycosylase domain-containing protein [Clostridiales bacterium]
MAGRGRRRKGKRRIRPFLMIAAILVFAVFIARDVYAYWASIPYYDEIASLCQEIGEETALVLAVIQTESRFRPNALSPRGAVGLMQIMPATARWMADRLGLEGYDDDKLYEREWNLTIGISYLQYLRRQFPDSLPEILAAYNAGPLTVRNWLDAGDWDGSLAMAGDIPYRETRNYVKTVMKAYDAYRKMLVLVYDAPA